MSSNVTRFYKVQNLVDLRFEELREDPTSTFQTAVQNTLRKMKQKFDQAVYSRLYPSSSQPGLFFGLAKVHKLKEGQTDVKDLPLRPVISNIGTTTYQTSKYLAKLLTPLTKSDQNIDSTKDFIDKLKTMRISEGYKMVSLDVVSLFTSVPLDYTINLILDKVFKDKLVKTKLSRAELKELLELCTKKMHFSFNNKVYKQTNGVAMGSPLGPVIANIFMVHLEQQMVPRLAEKMSSWYRYVDDTFTFIKDGEVESVQEALNSFHEAIQFTFEEEKDGRIAFLDVMVNRKTNGSFDTSVYRKKTDSSIYIKWDAFASRAWKIGTLKGLFRRAFLVCSTNESLDGEINHLKYVFSKINGYPSRVVNDALHQVQSKLTNTEDNRAFSEDSQIDSVEEEEGEGDLCTPYICLPYKGSEGDKVVKSLKNTLLTVLPKKIEPRFVYKGTKIGSFFSVKDKVGRSHRSNLVYGYKPPGTVDLKDGYVGETNVRFGRRTQEHASWDKNSSVYKNSITKNIAVSDTDFMIIESGYPKPLDRKIAEALYVKDFKPVLNAQKISYKLKLFN